MPVRCTATDGACPPMGRANALCDSAVVLQDHAVLACLA